MATLFPYLIFENTCEEAFLLYKSVFGGEFDMISKYKDMPPSDDFSKLSEAEAEKIMHVSLPINNGLKLLGSDNPEMSGRKIVMGNNVTISIDADSKEEADRLFNGLSEGGNVTMPMNKTFWGAYFGMFTDRFGIYWIVNFDENSEENS